MGAGESGDGCGNAQGLSRAAAELFQMAALLMGDEAEAVKLVEDALASVEIDPCLEPAQARQLALEQLVARSVLRLRAIDPVSFAGMPGPSAAEAVCVEDDDLSGAGMTQGQLTEWLMSGGRADLQTWLARLPAARRAIFVQRAILGRDNAATAQTMQAGAGPSGEAALAWTPQAVGEAYRQTLCSLANSLAHSPGVMAEPGALSETGVHPS